MNKPYNTRLESGYTYHIYNQGNNGENLFKEERNYGYFLKKYKQYISPICHTYAYCLLPNHFHLMVQFKNVEELHHAFPKKFPNPELRSTIENFDIEVSKAISNQFRFFFGAYSKAINKSFNRRGKLFSQPFKRVIVDNEPYFTHLVAYIHRNPLHHNFCRNYKFWKHSSYFAYVNSSSKIVQTRFLLEWFYDLEEFLDYHDLVKDICIEDAMYLE